MLTRRARLKFAVLMCALFFVPPVFAQSQTAQNQVPKSSFRFTPYCEYFSENGKGSLVGNNLYSRLGISEAAYDRLCSKIWSSVGTDILYAHVKDESLDSVAKKLIALTESVVKEADPQANNLLRQWATAEAICAYVARNIRYHVFDDVPGEERWPRNSPKALLASQTMYAQCSGYSLFGRDLANACNSIGLSASYVWGWTRWPVLQPTAFTVGNHGWVLFHFEDGTSVPGDITMVSRAVQSADSNRRLSIVRHKPFPFYCLPRREYEWEYFLATHWGLVPPKSSGLYGFDFSKTRNSDGPNPLMSLTWAEWNSTDIEVYASWRDRLESRFGWRFSDGKGYK